jgi:hypothetical protein
VTRQKPSTDYRWSRLVASVHDGKRVGTSLYLHATAVPPQLHNAVAAAYARVGHDASGCDVVKLSRVRPMVSLLRYPGIFREAFPRLTEAWSVDLVDGTVGHRTYGAGPGQPVLHRKELLLRSDDPRRSRFAALTASAEERGLFDAPGTIGQHALWERTLRNRGLVVRGHRLVTSERTRPNPTATPVERHRTAIARRGLSMPVAALRRHGLLTRDTSFFDYGCGQGDDVATLRRAGIAARGWDPHFLPDAPRVAADVVNLGFVLNVIENPRERNEALSEAYGLARRVLAVSVCMTCGAARHRHHRSFRDGVITSRGTFQKSYTQAELGRYIRSVLGQDPVPAGSGLYFVFRNDEDERRFREAGQRAPRP